MPFDILGGTVSFYSHTHISHRLTYNFAAHYTNRANDFILWPEGMHSPVKLCRVRDRALRIIVAVEGGMPSKRPFICKTLQTSNLAQDSQALQSSPESWSFQFDGLCPS